MDNIISSRTLGSYFLYQQSFIAIISPNL